MPNLQRWLRHGLVPDGSMAEKDQPISHTGLVSLCLLGLVVILNPELNHLANSVGD